MSISTAARIRATLAVVLVIGVVIAVAARRTHPTRREAAPVIGIDRTTTTLPGSAGPGTDGAPATTPPPAPTASGSAPGARAVGAYANGAPARLDVPAGAPLDPLAPPDAGWRALSAVQGNGNGTYAPFTLSSSTSQVRFRSSAADFHVFVVDEVQGRDATAGFADVDCSGPCADLQTLTVPKGSYHIEVDANGPWELSMEQYG